MSGKHKIEHVTAILIALEGTPFQIVSLRRSLFLTIVENGINLKLPRSYDLLVQLFDYDMTRRVSPLDRPPILTAPQESRRRRCLPFVYCLRCCRLSLYMFFSLRDLAAVRSHQRLFFMSDQSVP
jgi:hypothetical protein